MSLLSVDHRDRFIFHHKGHEVGSCHLCGLSNQKHFFVGLQTRGLVAGTPTAGYAITLELAEKQFRSSLEKMLKAGFRYEKLSRERQRGRPRKLAPHK